MQHAMHISFVKLSGLKVVVRLIAYYSDLNVNRTTQYDCVDHHLDDMVKMIWFIRSEGVEMCLDLEKVWPYI